MDKENYYLVGYAYVPMQKDFTTYNVENAIQKGTLFPELDLGVCEYLNNVKGDTCNG